MRGPMVGITGEELLDIAEAVGGVTPPALAAAREEESRQESLRRERMWYVACTRARDLLIIPHLPAAS
jgi:CRISPR-associated exonuclease Cas4